MTNASPADEARKGLLALVTGKAKEVAGAVLGNDSLAAEGQLQQAEAAARKDASATNAVAEVRAKEAAEELAREHAIANAQRAAVETAEAGREEQVREQAAGERLRAAVQVERQEALDKADVDARIQREQAVAAELARADRAQIALGEQQATAEHEQQRERAEAAEKAAARARDEADRLAAEAGLTES